MNFVVTTYPTGRSPKGKKFFGNGVELLDRTRPKDCSIGDINEFNSLLETVFAKNRKHITQYFSTCGKKFAVITNSPVHKMFVQNMFDVYESDNNELRDWTIYHNTEIQSEPKIWINLESKKVCIVGTSYLGEIKKCVFTIMGYELPQENKLPMHCSSYMYDEETNLMFGLSGTGKTTLSSDPDYQLIGDDEIVWHDDGIINIESGCYAKLEGLTEKTHKTIFDAMDNSRKNNRLITENKTEANARSSYRLNEVPNALPRINHSHPKNIFFLTMDAEGIIPPISKLSNTKLIRLMFETGYTSKMPGTESGVKEITKVFSPCYGSPFMPLSVKTYSDMLLDKIKKHNCNVFLVNTGMDKEGDRYPLEFTRDCVKNAHNQKVDNLELTADISKLINDLKDKRG